MTKHKATIVIDDALKLESTGHTVIRETSHNLQL
jgi:hypothetical protein